MAAGAKLTFTGFIAKVIVDALRQFPAVNASIDGDNIVYKKDINLGIAVALEHGLIVPVIRNADEKNLLGLSRAINDLAARARTKKLSPDDVQAGTFTITNPNFRRPLRVAADQSAAGRHPRRRRHREARYRRRRCDSDQGCANLTLGYDHRPGSMAPMPDDSFVREGSAGTLRGRMCSRNSAPGLLSYAERSRAAGEARRRAEGRPHFRISCCGSSIRRSSPSASKRATIDRTCWAAANAVARGVEVWKAAVAATSRFTVLVSSSAIPIIDLKPDRCDVHRTCAISKKC